MFSLWIGLFCCTCVGVLGVALDLGLCLLSCCSVLVCVGLLVVELFVELRLLC